MAKKLVFGKMPPHIPPAYPIPLEERPVFFDVGQYLRQCGGEEDFTAEDAARVEALGDTVVWPVPQEPTRP
jgi:hypothetical protein